MHPLSSCHDRKRGVVAVPSGPFHGEGPGTSAIGSISCEWEQRGGCSTTGSVSGDRKRGKAPVPLGPFHGREPRGERGGCSASGHISEDGERAKGREGWLQCLWTHFRGWGDNQGVVAVPLNGVSSMDILHQNPCFLVKDSTVFTRTSKNV